jgi:oligopeptidase A (EC:3.4.24.70). Metallo peptidase. MEROPS family M03A
MNNPLLAEQPLPPFDAIQTDHIVPAVKQLLIEARSALETQLSALEEITWATLVAPIEERGDRLNKAWSPVGHLNSVKNSEELRVAYEESRQLLTEYFTELGQNEALFSAYTELRQSDSFDTLSQAQKKTIENALRDFRLSGIALPKAEQQRYGDIQSRLSTLTSQFSNNVLDATHGWHKHIVDENELTGLPEFAVAGAKEAALKKSLDGWVLTLDTTVYFTVITQSKNAALRKEMYTAYSSRASDQGPCAGEWDNSETMDEILQLRQELATLLGFNNYAEYSIETKMAGTTEQVTQFLRDLAIKSKPYAEQDLKELKAFANAEYGVTELNAWDLPYYSEKLKLARYSISQEELRPYFPAETVIAGLFNVANQLFDITFEEKNGFSRNVARYG